MIKTQAKPQPPSEPVAHEPCPCREFVNSVRELLGVSPAVRQHLANSRVEFLKAIRQVIDDRIQHLSAQPQTGTKVTVE